MRTRAKRHIIHIFLGLGLCSACTPAAKSSRAQAEPSVQAASYQQAGAERTTTDAQRCHSATSCVEAGVEAQRAGQLDRAYSAYSEACRLRLGQACAMALDVGIRRQDPEQLTLMQRGCASGQTTLCLRLGQAYERGELGLTQDAAAAALIYSHACDRDDAQGCARLGLVYLQGRDIQRDDWKAKAALERACDGGAGAGCFHLGWMLYRGRAAKRDIMQAQRLYARGCKLGELRACTSLGTMYERGDGVVRDFTRALELFEQACDQGEPTACDNAGLLYQRGDGTPVNLPVAYLRFERACRGGDLFGCHDQAQSLWRGDGVTQDDARALNLWEQTCKGGLARACRALGQIYLRGAGSAAKDEDKGRAFLWRACLRGDDISCQQAKP